MTRKVIGVLPLLTEDSHECDSDIRSSRAARPGVRVTRNPTAPAAHREASGDHHRTREIVDDEQRTALGDLHRPVAMLAACAMGAAKASTSSNTNA